MFVGVTACGKIEFLLQLLETAYKNHFEFIVILCQTILYNKTYLFRKWIFEDKNVFIVCDEEGKLNEWIKLFKNMLKGHQILFIIDDCSAEGEISKNRDALSELAFSGLHINHSLWVLTLFIPGFFGWCRGGYFPPPPCNSSVFQVRRLKFCTELL